MQPPYPPVASLPLVVGPMTFLDTKTIWDEVEGPRTTEASSRLHLTTSQPCRLSFWAQVAVRSRTM